MRPFALALLAVLLLAPARAHAADPRAGTFDVEHVVTLRGISQPAWSPDGRRLAFTVSLADTVASTTGQDLWMWDAATGDTRQLTRDPKNDHDPAFSPGGDTLAFVTTRGSGEDAKSAIWFLPLRGGEPWAFVTGPEAIGEIAWSPDGRSIAYTQLDTLPKQVRDWRKKHWDQVVEDEQPQYNHLWLVDVASGKSRRLTAGAFHCATPRWSPDSKSVACIVNPTAKVDDENASDLAVIDVASGRLRKLDALVGGEFAWSPDSRWLAWAGGTDRARWVQKNDVWVVRADGGERRNLTSDFDEDGKSPAWSAGSDTLFFHAAIGATTLLASVPLAGGEVTLGRDRQGAAGTLAHVPAGAAARGRVAWVRSGTDAPNELWVADDARLAGAPVTALNADVAKLALGNARLVRWTSTDGVKIEGVLLRPAGAPATGAMKTLVLLHGGPYAARYDLGFDFWSQFLAGRGWQVFMPNFRSSGGYGTAFMLRTRADWGGQDWRDVTTGVDSLVKWGLADGKRLGLLGHSYGGYLTAWGITQTNAFRAAVVSAGAVDLPALWAQSDTHRYRAFEFEGEPWRSYDKWRAASPIAHIADVKTPVLIFNGESDPRIPYPQAQETYQSLSFLGVPCEFVHYPHEGHGLRDPRHREDWLMRQAAWFDRWIK